MGITDVYLLILGTVLGALVTLYFERMRSPLLEIKLSEPMYLDRFNAQWLKLRIVNRSSWSFLGLYRNPALRCRGFIKFYSLEQNRWMFDSPMEVRWPSSRELIVYDQPRLEDANGVVLGFLIDPYQLRLEQTVDIWSGTPQNFDVAFRYIGEDDCYGWSNENYRIQGWRIQERKLPKGIYIIEVSIASASRQHCKGFFRLINDGDNDFHIEETSSEEREKIIDVNRIKYNPENWRKS